MEKTKIDMYVIDRVKEKRIEKNLSQDALANELGISSGFIGKVESPAILHTTTSGTLMILQGS